MIRNITVLLTSLLIFCASLLAETSPPPQRARATSIGSKWQTLMAAEKREPSLVVETNRTKKNIEDLRIDGSLNGVGRFRAILSKLRKKSWDRNDEGGDPFILLQGSARFLSGDNQGESFPAAATAFQRKNFTEISLFLFGDSVRRERKTALYHLTIRYTEKTGMRVHSVRRGKWDHALSSRSGKDSHESCIAKQPEVSQGEVRTTDTLTPLPRDLSTTATFRVLDLVAQMDQEYAASLGGNAVSEIATMLNAMESIYERDLSVTLNLQIDTTPITINTDDGEQVLDEYTQRAQTLDGDLYHLFSGKGQGDLLGIAYVGVVCAAPAFSTGVSYYTDTATTILTAAHEIGHNFDADHDSQNNDPPTIMFPSAALNLISEFSQFSKGQIGAHIDNFGSCLATTEDNGGVGEPTPTPTGTPGGTIDDPEDPEEEGELSLDLYSTKFRKRFFLVAEAFTEFEFVADTQVDFYYGKRLSDEFTLVGSGVTAEEGAVALRARRKGFYFALVNGTEIQSPTIRIRRVRAGGSR